MLGDTVQGLDDNCAEDMDLNTIGPPPGLSEEVEDLSKDEATLNPKAAEFHPSVFLAEYDKARKVGPKSQKAKTRPVATRPLAIPEEPITGSSETASGGEETGELTGELSETFDRFFHVHFLFQPADIVYSDRILWSTRNPRQEKTRTHWPRRLLCSNPHFQHSLHRNPQVDFECKVLVNLTNFPCE
eukprot:g15048.t1